jgi:hypothetical protein
MTIEKWLSDVYQDNLVGGNKIWNKESDGENQLVVELRGWGALLKEFKTMTEAEKFQNEVGEFIVQAIKEKILKDYGK